ncbi:MAG: YggT family protein [Anaerolineae bacterium]|jgi:YggT family protein
MFFLYRLINALFTLYTLAIIARALLPVFGLSYAHPVMRFLSTITEPLLAPIRRRLPYGGPVDFSPLVLILLLWLVEQVLIWVLF